MQMRRSNSLDALPLSRSIWKVGRLWCNSRDSRQGVLDRSNHDFLWKCIMAYLWSLDAIYRCSYQIHLIYSQPHVWTSKSPCLQLRRFKPYLRLSQFSCPIILLFCLLHRLLSGQDIQDASQHIERFCCELVCGLQHVVRTEDPRTQ